MSNIITNRIRLRREVSPLTVSVSVVCTTPASPVTQVFDNSDESGAQYSPDRTLIPTVLQPVVSASASDGSWDESNSNARLANMKWLANGQDITTLSDWTGLYTIYTTTDATRGSLEIRRNVTVAETIELTLEADMIDFRTDRLVHISSDPVTLKTTAISEPEYALHLEEDPVMEYDAALDDLSVDDYNRAHGLACLTDTDRQTAMEARNSYLRHIPLTLMRGGKAIGESSDITYRIYRVGSDGTLTELNGDGWDECADMGAVGTSPVIDMRLTDGGCYLVKAVRTEDGKETELARTQFHLKHRERSYFASPTGQARLCDSDTVRMDLASVKSSGQPVARPERLMELRWMTESETGVTVQHSEGSVGRIDLAAAGAIDAPGQVSDSLDVYLEVAMRPRHAYLTYGGTPLTNGGTPLIIN